MATAVFRPRKGAALFGVLASNVEEGCWGLGMIEERFGVMMLESVDK
jgi:hypothetical protein